MTIMVCTFFSVAVIAAQSETFKTGDANLDGVVNIKDATLIQKHIAEIATIDQNGLVTPVTNGVFNFVMPWGLYSRHIF